MLVRHRRKADVFSTGSREREVEDVIISVKGDKQAHFHENDVTGFTLRFSVRCCSAIIHEL